MGFRRPSAGSAASWRATACGERSPNRDFSRRLRTNPRREATDESSPALERWEHPRRSVLIDRGALMMLKNKVAVVYGAGGAVGRAVSQAFAREGARLLLTGRSLRAVEALAAELSSEGAAVQAAEVDALDEGAIDRHLRSVIADSGRVDISFNAVGLRNTRLQGIPLAELELADFARP